LAPFNGKSEKHESKTERTPNSNFQRFVPDRVEHVELDCAAHTEKAVTKLQRQCRKLKSLLSQETEQANLHKTCVALWLSRFLCVIFFVVQMTRNVDEATNFAFVRLTDKQPGLYKKSNPEYFRSGFGAG
jgi:hypothetical protein